MKKVLASIITAFMLFAGVASAHGGDMGETPHLSVVVNGVKVDSSATYFYKGNSVYTSAEKFAALFGKSATASADKKTVTFNGKKIAVRYKDGVATASVRDLANAVGAQKLTWDKKIQEMYVLALPAGTMQLEPSVVPAMGEHWSNPQAGDLPLGPIYGVYKGKLVFLEYMIAKDDFEKGVNHVNVAGMKGVPSPSVVQTDIEFQSKGHPGFEVPHYDFHMYFISDDEQQAIK